MHFPEIKVRSFICTFSWWKPLAVHEYICGLGITIIIVAIMFQVMCDASEIIWAAEFYEDRIKQELFINSLCNVCFWFLDKLVSVNKSVLPFSVLNRLFTHVNDGLRVHNCSFAERVAIVVPCRNRSKHLRILLLNLHAFLSEQPITYGIFFTISFAQHKDIHYNKGASMNGAFVHLMESPINWTCIIFHDVDLLPENALITYNCLKSPRHLSTTLFEMHFSPVILWLGVVVAFTPEQFVKLNVYSNSYWGWGAI
uniref:Galactosyltransferase N-terminal domain-containing protein n=1 Tax=Trichuris muris TaxID=70415 RepID=A0A5S6QF87_TRIMR